MMDKRCFRCPWRKLALARGELLEARARHDGRRLMVLHEIVSELEAQVEGSDKTDNQVDGGSGEAIRADER